MKTNKQTDKKFRDWRVGKRLWKEKLMCSCWQSSAVTFVSNIHFLYGRYIPNRNNPEKGEEEERRCNVKGSLRG